MLSTREREELLALDPSNKLPISMRISEDESPEQKADKLFNALKDDIFYIRLKQMVWNEYSKLSDADSTIFEGDAVSQLLVLLEESGIKEVVKNTIVKTYERSAAIHMRKFSHPPLEVKLTSRSSADEPVESIRNARIQWENGINEELQAIAAEHKRPFVMLRAPRETNPLLENNILQSSHAQEGVKFLFDSEDLLETGLSIHSSNIYNNSNNSSSSNSNSSTGGTAAAAAADRYLGLLKLPLHVPSFEQILLLFPELSPQYPQLGIDDRCGSFGAKFSAMRHDEGESVLSRGGIIDARNYMRRGVPPSLRSRLWRTAVGLHAQLLQSEEQHFLRLRSDCDRIDLITDELFLHDIQTVVDDPRFFIFEEELKDVIFCFSRDASIRHCCYYQVHAPLLGLVNDAEAATTATTSSTTAATTAVPFCGVQPYLGFCANFAPLCYVFKQRASLYSVCKELYCTLWCKLNVLSSDPGTLLPICKTFECLLIDTCPSLVLHLLSIGVHPLKIAFPWIQLGFVGILEVDQLLHLWDRIIGFMDLTLLAVAAAAIFVERSEPLLRCESESEVLMVTMEASRLHIITLIQMFLFRDTSASQR